MVDLLCMRISQFSRSIAVISLLSMAGLLAAPVSTLAATKASSGAAFRRMMYNPKKTYKDEKVAITNSATRCLTASTKAAHAKASAQSAALEKKYNLTASSTGLVADAFTSYQNDLTLAWDAMNEPYCGFGAFGVTAVLKSYNKSIERASARFTDAMKDPAKLKELAAEGSAMSAALKKSTTETDGNGTEGTDETDATSTPALAHEHEAETEVSVAPPLTTGSSSSSVAAASVGKGSVVIINDDGITYSSLLDGFMK